MSKQNVSREAVLTQLGYLAYRSKVDNLKLAVETDTEGDWYHLYETGETDNGLHKVIGNLAKEEMFLYIHGRIDEFERQDN